jgi:hypothetical protein
LIQCSRIMGEKQSTQSNGIKHKKTTTRNYR